MLDGNLSPAMGGCGISGDGGHLSLKHEVVRPSLTHSLRMIDRCHTMKLLPLVFMPYNITTITLRMCIGLVFFFYRFILSYFTWIASVS